MTCYRPAIRIWKNTIDPYGEIKRKTIKVIQNYEIDNYEKYDQLEKQSEFTDTHYMRIPCGRCTGCRIKKAAEWSQRIMAEAAESENNWFVTLTYNPMSIEFMDDINIIDGVPVTNTGQNGTLVKEHISKFMDKLRKHYRDVYGETGIRFYGVGEYGGKTERPHYHICIFNMPIHTQMIEYKPGKQSEPMWIVPELEEKWGKGFVVVGRLKKESADYVAGYVQKKRFGKKGVEEYAEKGQQPEFATMSRKPGIGRKYFERNHEKIYENDEIIQQRGEKTIKRKPCSYYDRLYDSFRPEHMRAIKEARQRAAELTEAGKQQQTDLRVKERLQTEEINIITKFKRYERTEI